MNVIGVAQFQIKTETFAGVEIQPNQINSLRFKRYLDYIITFQVIYKECTANGGVEEV